MNILLEGRNFIRKCMRVWRVTKKPTNEEFKTVSRASLLGILLIGLVGFIVASIMQFFKF